MKILKITFIVFLVTNNFYGQVNHIDYGQMHLAIDKTLKEDERQTELEEKSTTKSGLMIMAENTNNSIRESYEQIRQRLNTLQPWLQLGSSSLIVFIKINTIIDQSVYIVELLGEFPVGAIEIYDDILTFGDEAIAIGGLITGITLQIGVINQMEQNDRMKLIKYAIAELNRLIYMQKLMINKMRMYKYKFNANNINGFGLGLWTNDDANIINETINNVESLGL